MKFSDACDCDMGPHTAVQGPICDAGSGSGVFSGQGWACWREVPGLHQYG